MRIILTGAGGFVGQALLGLLQGEHDVLALDTRLGGIEGIEGDLCDADIIAQAFSGGCDAVVHLATVPGGAAEQNPAEAKRVNVDGTMALIEAAAAAGQCPRFIFASSIAVFGDPLPAHVDDATPLAPRMYYGAHKAMMEEWIATQTRRGAISGLSLRFPGILARPKGPSGMKSAFMSDVFHELKAGRTITLPVPPEATMWLMSVQCLAQNLLHALEDTATGSFTLPAQVIKMGDMVAEIAKATGTDPALVSYAPDPAIVAGFGNQPPLSTERANQLGFFHDGSLEALVASALETLQ